MKRTLLLFLAAGMFAACNTENTAETGTETTTEAAETHEGHNHEGHSHETTAETDPICGMERTAEWTEYTANGNDTVWFCSATCKETYAARQGKTNTAE